MKALKCKMLGAKLAHARYSYKRLLCMTTIYLRVTLKGNGRQRNLLQTNFNELQMANLAVRKRKTSYNSGKKAF